MKRIEVKLSLPVVAPLLDVIKEAAVGLETSLAAPPALRELEAEFRTVWEGELLETQNEDVRALLALFDAQFFSEGVVAFDADNAETVVRACAAVRLRLRSRHLSGLTEEVLETGETELAKLTEPVRKAFMCYLFLATLQELIIQHLESSIIES
jgi:hypothetical protein